jgi:hypothetical protein
MLRYKSGARSPTQLFKLWYRPHKKELCNHLWRHSAVTVVSKLQPRWQSNRVSIPTRAKYVFLPQDADLLWGPLIPVSNGYRGAISLGVEPLKCEADQSTI